MAITTQAFDLFRTAGIERQLLRGAAVRSVSWWPLALGHKQSLTSTAFCKNRDEYFFWDPLLPTKEVRALMAEVALGQLP